MGSTLDSRFLSSALHPAVWVKSTVMIKEDPYSSKPVSSLNYLLNLFHIRLCLFIKHFLKNQIINFHSVHLKFWCSGQTFKLTPPPIFIIKGDSPPPVEISGRGLLPSCLCRPPSPPEEVSPPPAERWCKAPWRTHRPAASLPVCVCPWRQRCTCFLSSSAPPSPEQKPVTTEPLMPRIYWLHHILLYLSAGPTL